MVTTTENTPNKIISKSAKNKQQDDDDDIDQLLETLPREKSLYWTLVLHDRGFWCPERIFRPIVWFQRNYQSNDSDIVLATMPKSGTTWLKALVFSIVHRDIYTAAQSPLHTSNPHELVPFEFQLLSDHQDCSHVFATHLPYHALPDSIFSSKCKVVYLCRNPLDQFISEWHFGHQIDWNTNNEIPMEHAFELFLKGTQNFGPFWDQMLGYWNASLKFPEKVLFLKYEDLKKDSYSGVKKIAEFLQFPFTEGEEENGLIEEIVKLCSFESLSNMEANKSEQRNTLFRKGEVGDWVNYLNPSAAGHVATLMMEKFGESGLTFQV